MIINVKVHPSSSKEEVRKINEKEFEVWMKEKAVNNKANIRLIRISKKYFGKDAKILSGFTSRNKKIEIR